MQGKSSKAFKDELGFVGSEEIIHRNNICLLSVVQNLDADITQDGAPSLSADDEPSPMKPSSAGYGGMTNQTNTPGLTNPAWPQQQQTPTAGYYQESYAPSSLPIQNQEGSFPGPMGGAAEAGQYWQQPQYGNSQHEGQGQGHMGAGALQDAHQGNYPPSFPPGTQQGWHSGSGGNPPAGVVKQEPAAQSASFGFPPHRSSNTGPVSSSVDHGSAYATSSLPYGASFPPQNTHNAAYSTYQPTSGPSVTGGKLPPNCGSMGVGSNSSMGYQPHQQGFPAQAAFPPASQGHRDSRAPPPGGSRLTLEAVKVLTVCTQ